MKKYLLFIGVDISKSWIDVSLSLNGQKSEMLHKVFDNESKGFKKMLNWIGKYASSKQMHTTQYFFCMEHTGIYHMPLCCFLEEQKLDYALETALRIQRSLGLKRGKDDKADAMDISRYAYLHRKELVINPLPAKAILQLKNLVAFRARLIKYKNGLKVAAQEMEKFLFEELYLDIGLDTKQIIELIQNKIRKTETELKRIIGEHQLLKKVFDLATSVKGIGLINAIYLIIYTNAFRAFPDHRKFACYIGIAPFHRRSGSSLYQAAKVSHLGHRKLKALLSNSVMCAIQYDKELKAYYERKIGQGKNKFSVLNAIKNKLISRVFATVKRGTPYVELNAFA